MPRISQFFGIIISMYYHDHSPPHFHARYGEHEAKFGIDPISQLEGHLPTRATSLVLEWAALYQHALRENWQLLTERQPLNPIPPLD